MGICNHKMPGCCLFRIESLSETLVIPDWVSRRRMLFSVEVGGMRMKMCVKRRKIEVTTLTSTTKH